LSRERVDLRPSLLGLLTGSDGHPWVFDADICGGTREGHVAREGAATVTDVEFENAGPGDCPLLELGGAALSGRGRGDVHLRLEPVAPAHGNGQLELADVAWRGQGLLAIFRAPSASGSWRLEEQEADARERSTCRLPRPSSAAPARCHRRPARATARSASP
jgi:hypothetical protein